MKTILIALLIFLSFNLSAQNSSLKHHTVKDIDLNKVIGYMVHLPPGYHDNPEKKYPLLVFLHGLGQRSDNFEDLYKIAARGPSKQVENQGSLCFEVDGQQECFIVISPLRKTDGNWTGYAQDKFWDHILEGPDNYRYDPERIYLTGWSLGGNGCYERAYSDENADNVLAAIAPFGAWGNESKGCIIADRKIALWAFHGTEDDVISYNGGLNMFNAVNDCASNVRENKFASMDSIGHYNTEMVYSSDNTYYNPNLYEWLLTQRLNGNGSGNQLPSVNAGADVAIDVSTSTVSFTAEASDPDGTIATYLWTKVSGPAVTLQNTDSSELTATEFGEGIYTFRITVMDNKGATASDEVTLTVTDGSNNQVPTVDAGEDITVDVSADKVYFTAQASDADGTIASYEWIQVSGPSAALWNPDRPKLTVVKFTEGIYTLRVTVTDDKGATASDDVILTVTTDSDAENESPTVDAGEDVTVDVSADKVYFTAQASDADGTIASYEWIQVSGPSAALWNPDRDKLTVVKFSEGTYTLRVTVTDDEGATASDEVILNVIASSAAAGSQNRKAINGLTQEETIIVKDLLIENPDIEIFHAEKPLRITIFSMQGQIIYDKVALETVNLNNFENGLYFYYLMEESQHPVARGRIHKMIR